MGAVASLLSSGNVFVWIESLKFAFFGSVRASSNKAKVITEEVKHLTVGS